jgi:hypothetical protein
MWLENGWRPASSALQAVRPRLEPVKKERHDTEVVWRSEAGGSILARMRLPTQTPDGSAEQRNWADGALGRPRSPAVPTA